MKNVNKTDPAASDSVFVIGLGRFGSALAGTLVELGVEVMGVDTDQELINVWADQLTHVRVADASNVATLSQLGVQTFDAAVVAIGSNLESSILTVAALADLGVKEIWAKALTDEHGRILERVGAHYVVNPEKQIGERVARQVMGHVVDYYRVDEGFVLAEIEVPPSLIGVPLNQTDLRRDFAVTVVCVKKAGGKFQHAVGDTVPSVGDYIVVAGAVADAERFVEFAAEG